MKKILTILVLAVSPAALAADFQFENLSREDLKNIVGDFSASATHTSVSGAAPLGDVWGFEIGVLGGLSQANEIDAIFRREGVAAEADYLPQGVLLGRLSTPLNLTFEVGFVPELSYEDLEFSTTRAALSWSPDLMLPVDLGIKAHISRTDFGFAQLVNSVNTEVDYDNTVTGVRLTASYDLPFLVPYAGAGYVEGDGDMTISGTSDFFNFTDSQSASAKKSGSEFFIGLELDLPINFGFEYARRFGENAYTAKLSFGL